MPTRKSAPATTCFRSNDNSIPVGCSLIPNRGLPPSTHACPKMIDHSRTVGVSIYFDTNRIVRKYCVHRSGKQSMQILCDRGRSRLAATSSSEGGNFASTTMLASGGHEREIVVSGPPVPCLQPSPWQVKLRSLASLGLVRAAVVSRSECLIAKIGELVLFMFRSVFICSRRTSM